jgi:hypothetical protein
LGDGRRAIANTANSVVASAVRRWRHGLYGLRPAGRSLTLWARGNGHVVEKQAVGNVVVIIVIVVTLLLKL